MAGMGEKTEIVRHGQKITVSVIGGHDILPEVENLAHSIGKIVAGMECVLLCGGLDGVMMAASRGAKEAGGLTIGLLPGKSKLDANPYIDIALPTTIGYARNAMVACSADVVIALPGSYGTQSEICYALVYKRPVIDLGHWNIPGMVRISGVEALKETLRELIAQIRGEDLEKSGEK